MPQPSPKAQLLTDLENVFSTSTKAGKQVISKIVSTFRCLTEQATFSDEGGQVLELETETLHAPVAKGPDAAKSESKSLAPSLHIDLQIHISPEASPDQIDKIFSSMSKHLYGNK